MFLLLLFEDMLLLTNRNSKVLTVKACFLQMLLLLCSEVNWLPIWTIVSAHYSINTGLRLSVLYYNWPWWPTHIQMLPSVYIWQGKIVIYMYTWLGNINANLQYISQSWHLPSQTEKLQTELSKRHQNSSKNRCYIWNSRTFWHFEFCMYILPVYLTYAIFHIF